MTTSLPDQIPQNFEECCDFTSKLFDGVYGWVDEFIATILIVAIFNFIAYFVLKRLHSRFQRQNRVWADALVKALYKPLVYFTWFFAIVQLLELITTRFLNVQALVPNHIFYSVAIILAFTWFFLRYKHNILKALLVKKYAAFHAGASAARSLASDRAKIDVIEKVTTAGIIFLSVLLLMNATNQNMTTLIAFGGVGGLALAFASQEVVANFFGGVMIYLTHPFEIGDWINLPERNVEGIVEEIGWYMTLIRTLDKRPIYIPNSTFSKIVVMTPSRMSHRRIKENIGIRYADYKALKPIIEDIKSYIQAHPKVDISQSNIVNFNAFGSYSLDIAICIYLTTIETAEYYRSKEEILFAIMDIIVKNNAEMAFPTTDVHVTNGSSIS